MRINKVSLRGFSAHKETTVQFGADTVTFICGGLNSGKSSIAQAIELAITRECERYRKRTDDQRQFIHDIGGNDRFTVSVETNAGTATLSRPRTGSASFTWDTGSRAVSGDEGHALMLDKLGAPSVEVVTAVMATADIFDRDPKEQRAMVLGLIEPKCSWEDIQNWYADAGHDKEGLRLIPEVSSLAGIDIAYKAAFDERTAVNRSLKDLRPPDIATDAKRYDIPAIEARIGVLESERRELDKQMAVQEAAKKNSPAVTRARVLQSIEGLAAEALKSVACGDKELAEAVKRRDEAWKAHQAAAKARNEASDVIAELKAEVAQLSKNVDQLQKFNGICVAGQHECPASRDSMAIALKAQEGRLERSSSMLREAQIKFGAIEKAAVDTAAARGADASVADMEAARTAKAKRNEELRRLQAELAALPAEEGSPEDNTAAIATKIAEYGERIKIGKGLLAEGQRMAAQMQAVERVAAQRKELEQKKVHLENLCSFFGPEGIRVRLIEKNIAAFEGTVNAALSQYGFEFTFKANPWQILAKGRDVNRLSRSERFRLGVALQVAIAKASGLDFVLVDNMEILTPQARVETLKLLKEAGIGQAILILTLMVTEAEFLEKRNAAAAGGPAFFLVRNNGGVSEVARC
jgi:exonuclease SbcC